MISKKKYFVLVLLFTFYLNNVTWAQTIAPTLTATGNQYYCPLSPQNIVTSFNIANPDNVVIKNIYIQISQGYVNGQDVLSYTGTNPNISAQSFIALEGKIELRWVGAGIPIDTELMTAVNNVVFESSSATPSGTRTFSITIGEANYLPSTGHYYEYVPSVGITWTAARTAAEEKNYYGLQGYLATITSAEEAQLSGKQAAGAGWIGGSDAAAEGTWRWVTGPEAGKSFWKGNGSGSTAGTDIPYANWNTGNSEPNNLGDEDYAHVTAPGIGTSGSWNDLSNTGNPSGDYQPKGYIVEYGGMPGDPILNISASTTITIAEITATTPSSNCGPGTVTLSATASTGTVIWFSALTGGTKLEIGNTYTTPTISSTTTYYAVASADGICETGKRTPVIATIHTIPTIITAPNSTICEGNSGILKVTVASATATINWYNTATGGISFHSGDSYSFMPTSNITTYYVDATENGCTSPTRTEVKMEVLGNTVVADAPLSLNDISIIDDSNNNSITIKTGFNVDNYEFNLDRFDEFNEATIFDDIEQGIHTLYVRNKVNCEISKLEIAILGIPPFFTPNNDGSNDTWEVKGVNSSFYPSSKITIFNRFGKIMKQFTIEDGGWDGIFNGKHAPASDYWYALELVDNSGNIRLKKGHFSLIR